MLTRLFPSLLHARSIRPASRDRSSLSRVTPPRDASARVVTGAAGRLPLSAPFLLVACSAALVSIALTSATSDAATKTTKTTQAAAKTTKAAAKTTNTTVKKAAAKKKQPRITLGAVRKTQAERDSVRARQAKAASKVDALKVSREKAAESLAALNSNVRVTGIALARAERASAQAKTELTQARRRLAALEKQLVSSQQLQLAGALRTYATPVGGGVDALLLSETSSEAGRFEILGDLAQREQADAIDALRSLREDVDIERAVAEQARTRAVAYEQQVGDRLTEFRSAQADQERFASSLEERLERELAEAAALADLDATLSKRLVAQNEQLSRQLAAAGIGARGSGSYRAGSFSEVAGVSGGGDTHGIQVAPSLRGNLARLLAAAKADGIYLTGGGYRSPANQIRLRRAHCGSSTFAVYHMRSSQCRPPTARPGNSQHERGLAIDFVQNGRTLTRSSSAYGWLKRNAHRFGLKNLPSEPWHWSVNGR
jgi:LAS superfamily LD-carboxypeptidase LdcB